MLYIYTKKIDQDVEMKISQNKNGTFSVTAWDIEVQQPIAFAFIFKSFDSAFAYINKTQSKILAPV